MPSSNSKDPVDLRSALEKSIESAKRGDRNAAERLLRRFISPPKEETPSSASILDNLMLTRYVANCISKALQAIAQNEGVPVSDLHRRNGKAFLDAFHLNRGRGQKRKAKKIEKTSRLADLHGGDKVADVAKTHFRSVKAIQKTRSRATENEKRTGERMATMKDALKQK